MITSNGHPAEAVYLIVLLWIGVALVYRHCTGA